MMNHLEPLTRAQHSMWMGHNYHGSFPFHTAEWLVMDGPLDRELFQQAVHQTLLEARAIHWRVVEQEGKFYRKDDVQVRKPQFADLSGLNDKALNEWLEDKVIPPFNLITGYLYDYTFAHLGTDRYGLFIRAHHVALDGYAYGLLINRFMDYYQSLKNGTALKNKPFDHYSKYLQEEQQYIQSEQAQTDIQFWKDNFSWEQAPKRRLKRRLAAPFSQGYRFEDVIDEQTHGQLDLLAKELKLPSAMIVMAVFMAYIAKQMQHGQQCFGVPVLSRIGTSAFRIPCIAMNILPLRLGCEGSETLSETVRLMASRFAEIRPHQRCYFEQLRFVLEDFEPFENILFGPIVNWLPFPLPEYVEGCRIEKHTISAGPIEDFDMAVSNKMVNGKERLYLAIDGHLELYTVESLEGYWNDFMQMLKSWLDRPELQLKEMTIHKQLPE